MRHRRHTPLFLAMWRDPHNTMQAGLSHREIAMRLASEAPQIIHMMPPCARDRGIIVNSLYRKAELNAMPKRARETARGYAAAIKGCNTGVRALKKSNMIVKNLRKKYRTGTERNPLDPRIIDYPMHEARNITYHTAELMPYSGLYDRRRMHHMALGRILCKMRLSARVKKTICMMASAPAVSHPGDHAFRGEYRRVMSACKSIPDMMRAHRTLVSSGEPRVIRARDIHAKNEIEKAIKRLRAPVVR